LKKKTYNTKRGITITSDFHIDLYFDVKVSEDELKKEENPRAFIIHLKK